MAGGMTGDRELFAMHQEGGREAVAIYPNQGLHGAARAFGLAHERASQYLAQAPIMVFASGVGADFRASALYMQHRLRSTCEQGVKLKTLMRSLGYPLPLRSLKGYAFVPSHAEAIRWLSRTPTAVLGRIVPEKPSAQRAWLSGLATWMAAFQRRDTIPSQAHFDWAAEQLAAHRPARSEISDVSDLAIAASRTVTGGAVFSLAWSWPRAVEEMTLWHDKITCEQMLRGTPFTRDSVIDLGGQPDSLASMNLEFVALRTPAAISEEGSAMRHCVASYIPRVVNGDCHIVSIRRDGERAATMECDRSWRLVQLRRRFNKAPSMVEESAARFYAEMMIARSRAAA